MLVFYLLLLLFMFLMNNFYMVWLVMELSMIYFLISVMVFEGKNEGLIIYFFFQSTMSLLLFLSFYYLMDKLVFMILISKLGMFPFFYWMVVVVMKTSLLVNVFVLVFQKLSVLWMSWLILSVNITYVYFMSYLSMFFVMVVLLSNSDMWLLLVYSSIGNTGMILLSMWGSHYIYLFIFYLSVIFLIIIMWMKSDSSMEILLVTFMFLVIPPFILFLMKLYVVISMDFFLKLVFFLMLFDAIILIYYFSLMFMKFMLMDVSFLVYMMNLFLLIFLILFSNCVTMIVFN